MGERDKVRVTQTFFDTDFFTDSKIEEIEGVFGDAAPAYYQLIAFRILREGGPIRYDGAVAILRKKQIGERASEFVDACVRIGLFRREGEFVTSARAEKEIEDLREKREKWRSHKAGAKQESLKKQLGIQRDSNRIPRGIREDSEEEQEQVKDQVQDPEGSGEVQEGVRPAPPPRCPDDDPQTWSPERREAEAALQPAEGRSILLAPGFVAHQRRPMRKYPELWLNVVELMDAARQIREAGIPLEHRPDVFAKASSQAKKRIAEGREPSTLPVHGWLIGYCKRDVVEELASAVRLDTAIKTNQKVRTNEARR